VIELLISVGYVIRDTGSRKNKFTFLSVEAPVCPGAKAMAYQLIPSFCNAANRTFVGAKGPRKNKITFYPSRLKVIFARSGGVKILERACYSSGFATPGANKSNPNPGA
jgi:hypothetical protein